MKILKRLFFYVRGYWKNLVVIMVCTGGVTGLTLAIPLLVKYLLDNVLLQNNYTVLSLIVLLIPLIFGLKGIFTYFQGYLMNFVGFSCVKKIREEMFVKLEHLPVSFFQTWRTGEVFSRLISDVGILSDVMGNSVVYLVNDILILIGALSWMAWRSPTMTLLTLTVSPLIGIAVMRFGRWMSHVTHSMQSKIADLSNVLFEGVTGIQVVKSCGREDFEIQKFKNKNEEYFTWSMKLVQVMFTQTPVIEFLTSIGVALMIYYGGVQVIRHRLTVGDVFAFWTYLGIASNPIYRLAATITNLQRAKAAAGRIFEIIDSEDERDAPNAELVSLPQVVGKLEFQNVWFRYDHQLSAIGYQLSDSGWVLKDLNLVVQPGSVVALIGPSGAGKSSLVGLIPKFYKPTQGAVYLDGVELGRIPLRELRSHIGIVSQEILLFSGTIRENIFYGKPEASEEEIVQAAKAANAHSFILDLPEGYDAKVGERGITLSVGQRQRIAIARALLRNPKILILDEATSNLDTESELLIQEALERLMVGRTTFVIAHRLSTIRNADKIVAIDDGKIVEVGSHQELLAKRGLYSRLYGAQAIVDGDCPRMGTVPSGTVLQ